MTKIKMDNASNNGASSTSNSKSTDNQDGRRGGVQVRTDISGPQRVNAVNKRQKVGLFVEACATLRTRSLSVAMPVHGRLCACVCVCMCARARVFKCEE